MLRVGLTGGIGAGKSTVASALARLGAVVVDADRLAREVVEPGTPGLDAVVAAFGPQVLAADGTLDRPALGRLVFSDEAARRRLNAILHPRIAALTARAFAAAAPDAVVVHDVALLVENGLGPNYHLVLVVTAPRDERVRRLVADRAMAPEEARARIAAQADDDTRAAAADVLLDNGGEPGTVLGAVERLWHERLVPFEANVRAKRPAVPSGSATVGPDPGWAAQAARLAARVARAAGDAALRVDHVGPTAVPGLAAKDVVDLQLVVADLSAADGVRAALEDAGFAAREGERRYGGCDPDRPVDLRVHPADAQEWQRQLMVRDWLRAHHAERDAYAELEPDARDRWAADALGRARAWADATGWQPGRSLATHAHVGRTPSDREE